MAEKAIRGSKSYIEKYVKMSNSIISSGANSDTYFAHDELTGEQYAVKVYNKFINERNLDIVRREIRTMTSLDHPNIVKCQFSDEDRSYIYIYMNKYDGDLLRLLNTSILDEHKICLMFKQIVSAVKHIHENGIVHKDIKLENILYIKDPDLRVALTDFGYSVNWISGAPLIRNFNGTAMYAPPEVLKGIPFNGFKSDIWSLGILLYTLITGDYPFPILNDLKGMRSAVLQPIDYGKIRNPDLIFLLQHMIDKNPHERYDIDQVIDSKWLKE